MFLKTALIVFFRVLLGDVIDWWKVLFGDKSLGLCVSAGVTLALAFAFFAAEIAKLDLLALELLL